MDGNVITEKEYKDILDLAAGGNVDKKNFQHKLKHVYFS